MQLYVRESAWSVRPAGTAATAPSRTRRPWTAPSRSGRQEPPNQNTLFIQKECPKVRLMPCWAPGAGREGRPPKTPARAHRQPPALLREGASAYFGSLHRPSPGSRGGDVCEGRRKTRRWKETWTRKSRPERSTVRDPESARLRVAPPQPSSVSVRQS